MANNVLINFSADTGGLDEATRKLDELVRKEKELLKTLEDIKNKDLKEYNASKSDEERLKVLERFTRAQEKVNKLQADNKKEINDTKKSIRELSNAHKGLESSLSSKVAESSFRKVRRELEEQLRVMRLNGEQGSKTYEELRQKLAELNVAQREVNAELKQQSSATYVFDSILQGTQLATGGYSALTGAMSLFGSENKDLQ